MKPTDKVLRVVDLIEDRANDTSDAPHSATRAEINNFMRGFVYPNNITIFEPVDKQKLLDYIDLLPQHKQGCFKEWLIHFEYFIDVPEKRKIELSITEDELHTLYKEVLDKPTLLKNIREQLNDYINDPERKGFTIRESSYQYDAVMKAFRHCMRVGDWKNEAECVNWIKKKLDAKK